MKTLKVLSEQWFTKAPFHEVKMLAIKHLGIPADRMDDSHKAETSKRALARQVFAKNHEYGSEFEIIEPSNPFGKVSKRRSSATPGMGLSGEYRFIKNGIRAPEGDIRWEMMALLEKHTKFEDVLAEWDKTVGLKTRFKATGKTHDFNFPEQINWALLRGWIVKV
jgi:hypothetical protein